MKSLIILIFTLISIIHNPLLAQISWEQKSSMPAVGRAYPISFSIGDKGYFGTGGISFTYYKDFWEYDPVTDTWTQKADVSNIGRTGAVSFAINDRGYVGMGTTTNGIINDFWEYNPTTNSWSQKAIFPGLNRFNAVGFSINDKGYVGTGSSSTSIGNETTEFWQYDPLTNSWNQKADFGGSPRSRAVGFSIVDRGYIGTGYPIQGSSSNPDDFWEYNPDTDNWTQKANYPGGQTNNGAAFALGNNNGYIGMGYLNKIDFWKYDKSNDSWSQILFFEGPARIALTSCSINNKGYLGFGYSATSTGSIDYNDLWEFEDQQINLNTVPINYESNEISIYPNPTENVLNVVTSNTYKPVKYVIYDLTGKIKINTNKSKINVKNLMTGTYIISIENLKGEKLNKMFIKQ